VKGARERARTDARICHVEGRGFESHHPLLKSAAKVEISSSAQKTPLQNGKDLAGTRPGGAKLNL
jgi:hypothetical protein